MEEVLEKISIVSEVFVRKFKINELALEWKNKGYEVDIPMVYILLVKFIVDMKINGFKKKFGMI